MRISDRYLPLWLLFIWIIFLIVRIANLEQMPIYLDESIRGYVIWSFGEGNPIPISDYYFGSPLELFVLPLFSIFGGSILLGRLAVILASSLMIPILYLLRTEITNIGAVFVATLLALSPAFIIYQRVWKGDQLILTLFLLFIVCVFSYKKTNRRRYIMSAGILLGLCFLSKPTALILSVVFSTYIVFLFLIEVVRMKSIRLALSKSIKIVKPLNALLFIFCAALTSFLGWLTAVWVSSPGLSITELPALTVNKVFSLYFGELDRGVSAGERNLFYFLEFMTPRWYLWFLAVGISCVFFVIFRMKRSEFAGDSQFFNFTIYWSVLSFIVFSTMTYAYPRHSQYFLIPLVLTIGVLGNVLTSITELVENNISKGIKRSSPSKFAKSLERHMPILLIGFLVVNTGILVFSSIPGISNEFPEDVRKNAAERTLQILDGNNGSSVLQIDETSYPWRWHFRNILGTEQYIFFYVNVEGNNSLSTWLMSEAPTAFYLLSTDAISQEIVNEVISNYDTGLNGTSDIVVEWFNPTEGFEGGQVLIYYR